MSDITVVVVGDKDKADEVITKLVAGGHKCALVSEAESIAEPPALEFEYHKLATAFIPDNKPTRQMYGSKKRRRNAT